MSEPLWPDGTVRLPDALEAWLDGHFAGEKGDVGDELEAARNATAVALWSLIHRQGDHEGDQAALDVLSMAAHGFVPHTPLAAEPAGTLAEARALLDAWCVAADDGEDLAPLRAQTLAWMEGS